MELKPETNTPDGGGTATADQEWAQVSTKRLHAHKLRKMIMHAEQEVREATNVLAVSKSLYKDTVPVRKVWEVFAGLGRTSTCLQEYPHVELRTFSLVGGWDFEDPENRQLFLKMLRDEKPDEILLAPMCTLWSPLQELNAAQSDVYRRNLIRERKVNHDTILTMCAEAYLEQQKHGRHATIEHPWNSRAWATKAFSSLEDGSFDCYVDQCMYGLVIPTDLGDEVPARKPTCFRTTKESLALELRCECDGGHYHAPLEGSYKGVSRSKMAEDYPMQLASQLAYLMQHDDLSGDAILATEDADPADVGDQDSQESFVYKNMQLQKEVGASVMQYIRRLHKNLGHPSPTVLTKMLEEIQATEDVLRAAREYECAWCHERKGPSGVPPAAGLTPRAFGIRLLADTAWVDTDDGRCCMMTMMDHATRYVAIRIMKDEQSVTLVKGLERGWIKHFGTPKYLRIDEGKGFAATHLRDWCSEHGIMLEIAPAESHNWLGSIERKHQVVRKAVELYMAEKGKKTRKTLLEAAIYCPGQINSLSYTRGFTPAQWVLGQAPRDTLSLTSSVFNPGMTLNNEPEDFTAIQQKRLAAQMAFLKADSDARLRRAMHQNYKENKHTVSVGQRCYYWRIQGTGKLQKNKWRGPARCVAEECDDSGKPLVLWLCHGTSLLRCSPHQVRPLVEDIGAELPVDAAAALDDLKALRARSTTQFKDVAELKTPEVAIEDLMDEEEIEYYPESGDDATLPTALQGAGALAFQADRGEERDILDEPPDPPARADGEVIVIDGPEPDAEADVERKRALEGAVESPKRARTSAAIPVPDIAADELLVEGAYIAEIHDDTLPPDWVLIEGQFELDEIWLAQLRGGEVNEKNMTVEEREKMIAAKVKELSSFFDNQVWDFVEVGKVKPERVVTARWVLTWKLDQETGLTKAKARLVLKGFQDPDIMTMEKTAPTASKSSKMLLLALTPNMGWTIMCGDVRAAFLSGATFQREIIVKLPKDCGPLLGIPAAETFMKMNKSAYGFCDAPLLWWKEADRRLQRLKMVRHRLDKCCYMLYDDSGQISLLILHVDDILIGLKKESKLIKDFLIQLQKAFDFGKWQELAVNKPVHYCGGRICLQADGSVSLDFQEYIKKVMPVTIAKGRSSDAAMTASEISKARGLLGALQWPATQGCPHLNATVSILAADISNGKVQVLLDLNKALRFAKSATDFKLVMKRVYNDPSEMCFICYSDAAFGVRGDGASQGGYILVLTNVKALEGASVDYNLIGWRSFKLTRVCRSSLSAESQACSGALDELMMVKTLAALAFNPDLDPRDEATAAQCGRAAIVIDAKGLYDALHRDGIGSGADESIDRHPVHQGGDLTTAM